MKKNAKKKVPKLLLLLLSLCLAVSSLAACSGGSSKETSGSAVDESAATLSADTIRLATTTSTKDSGLLDEILPLFTAETGYEVEVISVGSGEAMALGASGEADVLLVHSPAAEAKFIEEGNADETGRLDVMYNDFVIVGPIADTANIRTLALDNAGGAFIEIQAQEATFISRGDESGTHNKELSIWKAVEIEPAGDWYVVAGAGMGAVITMANEMEGYTLADRATWLANANKTDLMIVSEKDPSGILNNQYGVICVNTDKNDSINHDGAVAFQQWITSPDTQKVIGEFGATEYGEALFTPNAAVATQ